MNGITSRNTTDSLEIFSSSGTHVLDHLAPDGAGLAGGQVTVIAVGQVDTDLACLISILKRSMASRDKGDVDLVVVLHTKFSPFAFFGRKHFPKKAFSVPWS